MNELASTHRICCQILWFLLVLLRVACFVPIVPRIETTRAPNNKASTGCRQQVESLWVTGKQAQIRFRSTKTACGVQTIVPRGLDLTDDMDDEDASSWAIPTTKLMSYVFNIIHARQQPDQNYNTFTKSIRSLVGYLNDEATDQHEATPPTEEFQEAFSRSTIQAVRAAGDVGDFRLIFKVVEAAISYATRISNTKRKGTLLSTKVLPPRLFGEAIECLAKHTQANASKIRQMWQLGLSHKDLLTEPMGTYELNTMLRGLASRGKIRASLDLYYAFDSVAGDAYTASALFGILMDSIEDGQTPAAAAAAASLSPCWQWNEAMNLLDDCFSSNQLNNHAYAAALKLNERASQVFDGRQPGQHKHYIAKNAMELLERMKKDGISPDVVTCTLVMSAFDKGYQWKAAVALLNAMNKQGETRKDGTTSWSLPNPNVYSYAAAISACAKCNEYMEAHNLLNRMRQPQEDDDSDSSSDAAVVLPNTWVYNAALAACVESSPRETRPGQKLRGRSLRMALTLLEQMQRDHAEGMDAAPDTVSYNTALAAIDGTGSVFRDDGGQIVCEYNSSNVGEAWSSEEDIAKDLMEQMKWRGVPRNSITYRNAILATRYDGNAVIRMLEIAMEDTDSVSVSRGGVDTSSREQPQNIRKLKGRAAEGMRFVFNSALSVLATRGDMDFVSKVFSMMRKASVNDYMESMKHLATALGASGKSRAILTFLEVLQGRVSARDDFLAEFGIKVRRIGAISGELFSAAITTCVRENDMESALEVLKMMRKNGLSPSSASMQEIALAYSRIALKEAALGTRRERELRKISKKKKESELKTFKRVSAARARSAYDIAMLSDNPPARLLSTVAKACSAAGLWHEGRTLLHLIHQAAIQEESETLSSRSMNPWLDESALRVLPGLHRSLLKVCASKGNVTAALWFVDDIQGVSRKLSSTASSGTSSEANETVATFSSYLLSENSFGASPEDAYASIVQSFNESSKVGVCRGDAGMKGEDWKLLMIAASKSGNWQVCMGTLQFLRPFLEQTNPFFVGESNADSLAKTYERLARALTAAILCFEIRKQYAWAVRAIDDWIVWSGRRPRKEAVLSAFRILAERGQGYEVSSLLSRVLQVPATEDGRTEEKTAAGITYEQILYVGATTSLHNNGLYEDADELYVAGVSQGYLPFVVDKDEGDEQGQLTLDLHGMNTAIAHSAVRIALQKEVHQASWTQESMSSLGEDLWKSDMIIVTGRGRNSAQHLRPVLRPEVQRMLSEEFYPPLSTTSIPGNMGALRVPAPDINAWLTHQRQQKGVRLLAVADTLKSLSSTDRLRRLIASSMGSKKSSAEVAQPSDTRDKDVK